MNKDIDHDVEVCREAQTSGIVSRSGPQQGRVAGDISARAERIAIPR